MSIRTTITLDDDVFERLKSESRALGIPFRQALNEVIRTGLMARHEPPARKGFRVEPKHMGIRTGLDYDNIAGLLELGEGENYR
jgi:hypothetical protein